MAPGPRLELEILDPRLSGWGFPHYGSEAAAGLDLHACLEAPLRLAPGASAVLIPCGFAMRIGDPGWCGLLAPRSGVGHRGLVLGNLVGIVDPDYDGPVMVSAWNRNAGGAGGALTVDPGDRLAQLVLVRTGRPRIEIVPRLAARAGRGAGGFGSTGRAARVAEPPDPAP